MLQEEYGCRLRLRIMGFERMRSILSAPLYAKRPLEMGPAGYLRFFREDNSLTQEELGRMLGGLSRQNVSAMENGRRPISRAMAVKLARLFDASVERFIG